MRDTAMMRRRQAADRVLATVLFTDIVGSTEMAADLGDRRWQQLVARHHAVVRAQLKRYRGREIDTAGDGFFVIFERPAQAISCAIEIVGALRSIGIQVRAGIHIGEVELSRHHAGGIAVHTGPGSWAQPNPARYS
jgi:class 3 adenylate cyclase